MAEDIPHRFVALMFGGIICSLAMNIQLQLTGFAGAGATYAAIGIISDHIVRYGAQGVLLTALIYSIWTNWGFAKYRWVLVKWIIFLAQTVFGIAFVDRWIAGNIAMLEAGGAVTTDLTFLANHAAFRYGALAQTLAILLLVCVSVLKPWGKKRIRNT